MHKLKKKCWLLFLDAQSSMTTSSYGVPNIKVESDHKLLEAILKKPLHQAPVRLQKMIMTVQKYSIDVVYQSLPANI